MAGPAERQRLRRGRGPRELAHAVRTLRRETAPPTLLASVQGQWATAVGERIAGEAEPVSERAGIVTIACRSAVWAEELAMLSTALQESLNDALGSGARVAGLRFVTRPR